MDVAVAEMAEGARRGCPASPRSQAALAASMKSATRDTGTETSCLIEPPSRPCTSESVSRRRQSALVLRLARARWSRPRRGRPRAPRRAPSRAGRARSRLGVGRGQLDQGIGFVLAGERAHRARPVLQHDVERRSRGMYSKAVSVSPARLAQALRTASSARCAEAQPTKAVAVAFGLREQLQHRRRDDAERAFRADEQVLAGRSPVLSLRRPLRPFQTRPSASTTSRPSTSSRVLP